MSAALDQDATPERLHALAAYGLLSESQLDAALVQVDARPTRQTWWDHARRSLLLLGGALLVSGAIFFIAANWQALGPAVRMGLVVSAMAGAALTASRTGMGALSGKVACVVAGLLVGPLFALFGQTYQTGADAWGLFAAWAALFIPFMLASRISGAVVLWLMLIHAAVLLWLDQVNPNANPFVLLCVALLLDGGAAALCERGAMMKLEGLQDRVAARVLVIVCSGLATAPAADAIFRGIRGSLVNGAYIFLGVTALVVMLVVYARVIPDLTLLSVAAVAGVVMLTSAISSAVTQSGLRDVAFLVIGMAVLGEIVVVTRWLRQWARTRRSGP